MPGWRRSLAVAAVLLALLPCAAAAQSAGDEQYQDPFASEPAQSTPEPTATPAPTAAPAPAVAQVTPSATPAPVRAAPAAQLPRTGVDAWVTALAGLGLLAFGIGLRAHGRRAP